MRIAFIAQPFDLVLPPHQSSIGLIIYNTARQLAECANVTVYYPVQRDTDRKFVDDRGVIYRAIDTRLDSRIGKLLGHVPRLIDHSRHFDYEKYYNNYIRRIASDAKARRFDIAHILDFSQFARTFKRRNPQTKVVLEMQCEWLAQLNQAKVVERLRHVDLITGCSNHITHGVMAAIPDLTTPCHTAYNGIDPDRFHDTSKDGAISCNNSRNILFVGRVSPEKGVHDLIEAMSDVVKHDPTAQLQIVGPTASLPLEFIVGLSVDQRLQKLARFYDGSLAADYQEYLERRVKDLQLQDNVQFVGAVPQADLADLYRGARILTNPSYSESFGMTVTEGMAVGLPVVVTAIGGMRELVEDNKTGFLVAPDHPKQLASALVQLLRDDQLCRDMGARGADRVRRYFSWRTRVDNLFNLYENLVN